MKIAHSYGFISVANVNARLAVSGFDKDEIKFVGNNVNQKKKKRNRECIQYSFGSIILLLEQKPALAGVCKLS